jgi:hypothetical protein
MVAKLERQQEWQERVAQWRASGLSQRAFALERGFSQKQISYWSRRLSSLPPSAGFVPVRVASAGGIGVISLRSANGWTLVLPRDVSASWLAEMMRAL